MIHWKPYHVFSGVNRKLAWRLLVPLLMVTGISGVGAKGRVLPNLWQEIPAAIEKNVHHGAALDIQPFFSAAFVFSILAILFLVMILGRAVDIQLVYLIAKASFALSLLWLVCAVMALLPPSLMGLHRISIVIMVGATIYSQFVRGGTVVYYWNERHFGDLATQVVFVGTYLAFAWLPLKFALTGR